VIRIGPEAFDLEVESARLTAGRTDIGALATFVGLVRDETGGLLSLTLEHYPGMAERHLAAIEAEARRRWRILDLVVVHRVGRLVPGEPIVFVGVVAAHRAEAFAACEFLMDWLKTQAPFWKFEERVEGGRWIDPRPEDEGRAERWDKSSGAAAPVPARGDAPDPL